MIGVHKNYDELFSLDNILSAWVKFRRGKAGKVDIMNFELHLEDNIFDLHKDLHSNTYEHSSYSYFQIFDNKKRDIYKAVVRDRIVHQIVYDYLLSLFDCGFIQDSYASRIGKGQYKAINAFRYFIKLACNKSGDRCFVLKCDVRKYFDNVDLDILLGFIREKVFCDNSFEIIKKIVLSFGSVNNIDAGIPLGNITSQIFANIYLNQLDKYVKCGLGCRFYVRYNDDFVIVSEYPKYLEKIRDKIIAFVKTELVLEVPLNKTSIRKIEWGIDFLGFVILPDTMLLRNKTKHKICSNICEKNKNSYFSILNHCNSFNLKNKIHSMERLQ